MKLDDGLIKKEDEKYIRCNEGPPQIAAIMAIPLPVKVMQPGTLPPMRLEHGAMRPVLSPDKPACSRHKFRDSKHKNKKRTCGNCGHGVPFIKGQEDQIIG